MLPEDKSGFDIANAFSAVWHRKWFIALTVLGVVALSFLVLMAVPQRFTAEALVALNTRTSTAEQLISVRQQVVAPALSTVLVKTETDILQSRALTEQVVQELGLDRDPEFNERLDNTKILPPVWAAKLDEAKLWTRNTIQEIRAEIGFPTAEKLLDERSLEHSKIISEMLDRLVVRTDADSYAIRIQFQSTDPVKAARIANAYANIYIRNQVKSRFDKVDQAQAWIAKQAAILRNQVNEATAQVADYRRKNDLNATDGRDPGQMNAQQVILLTQELGMAERDTAEAETRLKQAQEIQKRGGDVTVLEFVQESPFLQEMRREEARLLARQSQLSVQFTDSSPAMETVRAQLGKLRAEINREINKQFALLANRAAQARARTDAINNRMNTIRASARSNSRNYSELAQKEREIQAKNVVLESFMARYNEIANRVELDEPEARIVSSAAPPAQPSHPKKSLLLGVSFMGSLGLAISLVFLFDRFRTGFQTTGEIREQLALPTLGVIPQTHRLPRRQTPSDHLIAKPTSVYAESVRSAQLAVLNARAEGSKAILITSSLPGEGKTAFSLSLGRSLAQSGHRTLLIDCDLRRPMVSRMLSVSNQPGFADYLDNQVPLDQIVHLDDHSGMHYITAGTRVNDPQRLLGSNICAATLAGFKDQYDVVLIDSPPTMVASDSAILARTCETALYVVEWDKTPRRAVQAGVEYLRSFDIHVAGVVLSKVDMNKQRQYGDYVDFAFRYGEYYGN
jgi:succinoglycan biosynthesis transport protein ExoP